MGNAFAALTVELNAQLAPLRREMSEAVSIARSTKLQFDSVFASIGRGITGGLAGLAGAAGAGSLSALAKAFTDSRSSRA